MKESLEQDKKVDDEQHTIWLIIILLAIFAGILFFIVWTKRLFQEKALKSQLAKKYGVSTKVFVNWIRQVCPEKVKARYVGTKLKKIVLSDVYPHFGKPEDRPMDAKSREILTRKDINRALSIEQSTLSRRLRKLEYPQLAIGMTYEAFIKLKILPPRQVALILKHMNVQGYPMK